MNRTWWSKLSLLVFLIGLSLYYTVPTIFNLNTETTSWPYKKKVNLGLDLQGGLYMVLGVDFNKVAFDNLERQMAAVQDLLKEDNYTVSGAKMTGTAAASEDPSFTLTYEGDKGDAIKELIKTRFSSIRITGENGKNLEYRLSREFRQDVRERTVNQSIEVIRNRIDEFGVSEPVIASQGSDRITVELPGIKEVERAKDLIGKTAKLEFKMVDDKTMGPAELQKLIAESEKAKGIVYKEGSKFSTYLASVNEAVKGKIPENTEIAFERTGPSVEGAPPEAMAGRIPYLLKSKVELSGDDLQDAVVGISQENRRPEVQFSLKPHGATVFAKLTAESIGIRMAIVLDGIVHSAPVINGPIPGGRGVITLGRAEGDKAMKEAQDLAIVLRAGALPAQLEFLEQRVVGPSLGADSVANGAKAGIIGCGLIFLFMVIYYRASGVVAVISLLLNAIFTLAILIGMDATLTLPGIAGISLTIGMAVDSNVLIFERIRDELLEGKSVTAAITAGFQRAFTAIFDANITHGIIAAILMSFGTGPVRGFAVTLFIGILTTLFCAITVCKLIFDGYLSVVKEDVKDLSI